MGIDTIMIPFLARKQKYLEVEYFAQGHWRSKWQSQDLNANLDPVLLTYLLNCFYLR